MYRLCVDWLQESLDLYGLSINWLLQLFDVYTLGVGRLLQLSDISILFSSEVHPLWMRSSSSQKRKKPCAEEA